MTVIALFWLMTILASAYAALFGGRDGRWGCAIIMIASIATMPPQMLLGWHEANLVVFGIDLAVLGAFFTLVLRARSHWPTWACACQLIGVTVHAARLFLADDPASEVYEALSGVWAIPGQLLMIGGIVLDRRAGVILDAGKWSSQR